MKVIASRPFNLPRMYRHFAAVTLVATILLAVFADGENREAVAQVAKPAPVSARPIEPGEPRATGQEAEGSFGTVAPFGAPMVSAGSTRNNEVQTAGPQQVAARYNPTGLSPAEWAKLTPAQREEMLKKLRELRYGASDAERERQLARLVSSSAQRSGSSPSEDD